MNNNEPEIIIKDKPATKRNQHNTSHNKDALDIKGLQNLLKNSSAAGYYDIYFPTLGKTFQFKQLTVGQQRTISKNSSNFKEKAEQTKLRMALLKELCLDSTFNPEKITWPEFINALIEVRENNFIDPIVFNIKCTNTENCKGTSFEYTLDLNKVSTEFKEKVIDKLSSKFYEFTMGDNKIQFELNYPDLKKYILMLETVGENLNGDSMVYFAYSYIKNILVNGKEVKDDKLNDLKQLVKLIDETFNFNF